MYFFHHVCSYSTSYDSQILKSSQSYLVSLQDEVIINHRNIENISLSTTIKDFLIKLQLKNRVLCNALYQVKI